jgi:hypothetical protein
MIKTRTIHECSFTDIFEFAKEKYGIEWNPANDLFFRTGVLEYGKLFEVHPAEMPSYIMYMYKNKLKKSSDVPADVFAAMPPKEQARVILLAFGEANGVPKNLMVDAT